MERVPYRHNCPYNCGWYREWFNDATHLREIIVHPYYGRVTIQHLVHLDITWHDCLTYLEAKERLKDVNSKNRVAA